MATATNFVPAFLTSSREVLLGALGTGNTDLPNIADRGQGHFLEGGAVVVTSAIGATPTVKLDIQGSADGVNWFNVAYALVATPTTPTVAQITITTAVTTTYLLLAGPWRFLKAVLSNNTNVTVSATAYL